MTLTVNFLSAYLSALRPIRMLYLLHTRICWVHRSQTRRLCTHPCSSMPKTTISGSLRTAAISPESGRFPFATCLRHLVKRMRLSHLFGQFSLGSVGDRSENGDNQLCHLARRLAIFPKA